MRTRSLLGVEALVLMALKLADVYTTLIGLSIGLREENPYLSLINGMPLRDAFAWMFRGVIWIAVYVVVLLATWHLLRNRVEPQYRPLLGVIVEAAFLSQTLATLRVVAKNVIIILQ